MRIRLQTLPVAVALAALWSLRPAAAPAADSAGPAEVTIAEDATSYILANGIVRARIAKTGAVLSLEYQGMELLGEGAAASNSNGYWSLPGTQMGFGSK